MGERYLVTGVQLGMLSQLPKADRLRLVKDITNTQYIGESISSVEHDASVLEIK